MSEQEPEAQASAPPPEAAAPGGDAPRNGVINVAGEDWAIGLSWYTFDRNLVQSSLDRVLAAGGDTMYLSRHVLTGNIGIASAAMGHARNQRSAADALAGWRTGTWFASYPLGGGLYWIVAVVRGSVVEDTGALSEAEARNMYKQMTSADWGWETVYGDSSWELGGLNISEEAIVSPSLAKDLGSAATPNLDKISLARPFRRIMRRHGPWMAAVAVVIALILVFDVPGRIIGFFEEEIIVAEPTEVPQPGAWEGDPVAATWLLTCARNLRPSAYFVPGWDLARITCDAESDRIVYEYSALTDGVVEQLEVVWDDITSEKEVQLSDTVSFMVTPLGYAEGGEVGVTPAYAPGEISSIFFDMSLLIGEIPELGGVVRSGDERRFVPERNEVEVTPGSTVIPISMESASTPKRWYETYGLDGMVVDRVTYDGANWTYEGKIYAKQDE